VTFHCIWPSHACSALLRITGFPLQKHPKPLKDSSEGSHWGWGFLLMAASSLTSASRSGPRGGRLFSRKLLAQLKFGCRVHWGFLLMAVINLTGGNDWLTQVGQEEEGPSRGNWGLSWRWGVGPAGTVVSPLLYLPINVKSVARDIPLLN
jgi:hypothetical protein